jgi:hypothetical protein
MYNRKYTPLYITTLKENEIFVFGSNLMGFHGGGAAAAALDHFGAIWGQGVGLQGQSYAIPTMHGGPETIQPYVDEFIQFAKTHPELTFYVTMIGCGIAGLEPKEIAPLFEGAIDVENIILPDAFVELIEHRLDLNQARTNYLTHLYGVTKTLTEILLEKNKKTPFADKGEAAEAAIKYLLKLDKRGDYVAFDSLVILNRVLREPDVFINGELNAPIFQQKIFNTKCWKDGCKSIYEAHCKEKLANLVLYLNEYRHYTSLNEIITDLDLLKVSHINRCGPNNGNYFFNVDFEFSPYISFTQAIKDNWDEITTNGILDEDKFRELFFNKHERGIRKYGLEAVIKHDYEPSGPCHLDKFVPKKRDTSPYYLLQSDGKYSRMCGLNFLENYIESKMFMILLRNDSRYHEISGYFIPKEDMTLPVYKDLRKVVFANEEEKLQWIAKMLEENGDDDIQ